MPTEKTKMLNGEPYDASEPELVAEREHARTLTRQYNTTDETAHERRNELLDELLGSTGENCHVEPPFRCDYGDNIYVGENFYANVDCVMLDVCRVEIGCNCLIGPGVHIYTATHPIDAVERTTGLESGEPVTIGNDVWIGGRAVIDPSVTIGDDAVVGSGAVVSQDVPENVVVKGNPAEVVKELD